MLMAAQEMKVPEKFLDPSVFRSAMRELTGGVTIITSGSGARRRGLTATAVCSLSASPPALLVCINKDAECHRAILDHGMFCVNVLGSGNETLAGRFAGRDGVRGVERFTTGRWSTLSTGAPVLEEAIAAFDCSLRETMDGGTHSIFIGDVEDVRLDAGRQALVYRAGLFSLVN